MDKKNKHEVQNECNRMLKYNIYEQEASVFMANLEVTYGAGNIPTWRMTENTEGAIKCMEV
jgi:hypothetical protein